MKRLWMGITIIFFISFSGCLLLDKTPPANVSGLVAEADNQVVTLSWTDPGDADLAVIEITYNSQTVTIQKGIQQAEITGLANGTEYTFIVQAVDAAGNKSTGQTVTATPVDQIELLGTWRGTDGMVGYFTMVVTSNGAVNTYDTGDAVTTTSV